MRLFEFDQAANARLLTVLSFLRSRAQEKGLAATIKTQSLINMIKNAGDQAFDYQSLVTAHKSNAAVQNLIKNLNQDTVELSGSADSAASTDMPIDPEQTVDSMAKRALGRRS